MRLMLGFLIIMLVGWASAALATADGPDYFRLRGGTVVHLYDGGTPESKRIGTLPLGALGLRNLGCTGLSSYGEWSKLTEAERLAARSRGWCKVDYQGRVGWVQHKFLGEAGLPVSPGFDCTGAQSPVEALICRDPDLMMLDRQLQAAFAQALEVASGMDERPADAVSELRALQRGWITGRNDCWKNRDMRACVKERYHRRISELHVDWTLVPPAFQTAYRCAEEVGALLSYYDLLPRPAVAVETNGHRRVFVTDGDRQDGRFNGLFGRWVELNGNYALLKMDQSKPAWQCAGI